MTKQSVHYALRRLGLSGYPVCLHSSLRSLGPVPGGAEAVIRAFLDEKCTLMVPTFSWGFAVPPPASKWPIRNGWDYEAYSGPTGGIGRIYTTTTAEVDDAMGAIPSAVVTTPGYVRGDHPLNSFAAVGPLAHDLVDKQSPQDVYAPLRELSDRAGFVLLMGVGVRVMTLLHLAEQRAGRSLFRRWANDGCGQPQAVQVGGCSDGFDNMSPVMEPVMKTAAVGDSVWRLFIADEVLRRATEAIRSTPTLTRCSNPICERCIDAVAGGPVMHNVETG